MPRPLPLAWRCHSQPGAPRPGRRSQPAEDRPPIPAPLLPTPPRPRDDGQRRDSSSHDHEEILRVAHPAAQLHFTGVPSEFTGVPSEADPPRQRLAAHPEQHSLRHGCPVADATPDRDTGPNAPVASPLRPVTGYPGAGSPNEVPTNAIRLTESAPWAPPGQIAQKTPCRLPPEVTTFRALWHRSVGVVRRLAGRRDPGRPEERTLRQAGGGWGWLAHRGRPGAGEAADRG